MFMLILKEEEKGIEMSEDFGGKSQNLEQKDEDGDSDDDEEDGDELDKEMGETGDGAETLDQQVICSYFLIVQSSSVGFD